MDETKIKELGQNIESMCEDITTMGGGKRPLITMTTIDGRLLVYCNGKLNEFKALVAATMVSNETLREVFCKAADEALDYIKKHPEYTADK